MSPHIIGLIAGLLLMVLIPVAVYQRRAAVDPPTTTTERAGNEGAPRAPRPAITPTYTPNARNSLTTGQVALGVFLGLWMFAISGAILTLALMAALSNSITGQ